MGSSVNDIPVGSTTELLSGLGVVGLNAVGLLVGSRSLTIGDKVIGIDAVGLLSWASVGANVGDKTLSSWLVTASDGTSVVGTPRVGSDGELFGGVVVGFCVVLTPRDPAVIEGLFVDPTVGFSVIDVELGSNEIVVVAFSPGFSSCADAFPEEGTNNTGFVVIGASKGSTVLGLGVLSEGDRFPGSTTGTDVAAVGSRVGLCEIRAKPVGATVARVGLDKGVERKLGASSPRNSPEG